MSYNLNHLAWHKLNLHRFGLKGTIKYMPLGCSI